MARRTIHLFLLLSFLSELSVALLMGTYVMFLLGHGLTLLQINLINLAFHTTLFLCEVPTGVIADVWGRKVSYMLSCILAAAGLFLYGFSTTLFGFVLAEVITALGRTCASGAFEAWMVDRLKHFEYNESLQEVFVRERQINQATLIVGAMMGAVLADIDPTLPWYLSSAVMLVNGGVTWFVMKEEYWTQQVVTLEDITQRLRTVLQGSWGFINSNAAIRFLFAMGLVQCFAVQAPNMQWQPYFAQFLKEKFSFGILFAGMSLSVMVGALICGRLQRLLPHPVLALGASQVIIALGIGVAGYCTSFAWALIPFLIHEMGRGLFHPIKQAYLNESLPSEARATLLSFESLAFHAGGMLGLVMTGVMAEYGSMHLAWIFSGSTLFLATLFLVKKNLNMR